MDYNKDQLGHEVISQMREFIKDLEHLYDEI